MPKIVHLKVLVHSPKLELKRRFLRLELLALNKMKLVQAGLTEQAGLEPDTLVEEMEKLADGLQSP